VADILGTALCYRLDNSTLTHVPLLEQDDNGAGPSVWHRAQQASPCVRDTTTTTSTPHNAAAGRRNTSRSNAGGGKRHAAVAATGPDPAFYAEMHRFEDMDFNLVVNRSLLLRTHDERRRRLRSCTHRYIFI